MLDGIVKAGALVGIGALTSLGVVSPAAAAPAAATPVVFDGVPYCIDLGLGEVGCESLSGRMTIVKTPTGLGVTVSNLVSTLTITRGDGTVSYSDTTTGFDVTVRRESADADIVDVQYRHRDQMFGQFVTCITTGRVVSTGGTMRYAEIDRHCTYS
jgi:hypothetical protein